MPYLKLTTNLTATALDSEALLAALTDWISKETGKPTRYIQVCLETDRQLSFGGDGEPSAFVELRSIGLTEETAATLTPSLFDLLQARLGIKPDRIFINLIDIPRTRWGWNGATFG